MPHLLTSLHLPAHNDVLDEQGKLLKGKHEGADAAALAISKPSYLHYMLDTWDISEEDTEILQVLLKREAS